ncbi:hypothetical protein [Methanogenium sp. MK-MG]|nr:hypothetical protein [Methanogenium sp. MK-MG]
MIDADGLLPHQHIQIPVTAMTLAVMAATPMKRTAITRVRQTFVVTHDC